MSFKVCIFPKYHSSRVWQAAVKELRNAYNILVRKRGGRPLEDQAVDGWILLIWILTKLSIKVNVRTGSCGTEQTAMANSCEQCNRLPGSIKMICIWSDERGLPCKCFHPAGTLQLILWKAKNLRIRILHRAKNLWAQLCNCSTSLHLQKGFYVFVFHCHSLH
jgi:hypothetical protein